MITSQRLTMIRALFATVWLASGPVAFALSPADLLKALDRTKPELRAISTPHQLAEYYRNRTKPVYPLSQKSSPPDIERAGEALRHRFTSIGIPHDFGPKIDWSFDKTTAAGLAPNNEWTWQLNRHAEWLALSRAYRDTADEKYAREFVAQMTAWVRDCPMPETSGNVSQIGVANDRNRHPRGAGLAGPVVPLPPLTGHDR